MGYVGASGAPPNDAPRETQNQKLSRPISVNPCGHVSGEDTKGEAL